MSKYTTLYKDDQKISRVRVNSPKHISHLDSGWTEEKPPEFTIKENLNRSETLSGRVRYHYPDGTPYGSLYPDDPIIEKLNLQYLVTDAVRDQYIKALNTAIETNKGTTYYNNGVECRKFKDGDSIPSGWVKGILRDNSNSKAASAAANTGKEYWNNGTECRKFDKGINPGAGWTKGMLKRK